MPGMVCEDAFRCDVCGRFVSLDDLNSGAATHAITLPDSDYSVETSETLCRVCAKKDVEEAAEWYRSMKAHGGAR